MHKTIFNLGVDNGVGFYIIVVMVNYLTISQSQEGSAMATIEIYDVCNDYSVELNETRTFYGIMELKQYLKHKHGAVKFAPITKDTYGCLNWYCWNKYGELILQVYER